MSVGIAMLVGLSAQGSPASGEPGSVELSSRTGSAAGNNWSTEPRVSDVGSAVAFTSRSTNLVPQDTNGHDDVFVRVSKPDGSAVTERVSVASSGRQGNGNSHAEAISANGRFVVFKSSATNLVAGDTNDRVDLFLRDRTLGKTERVSVNSAEGQATYPDGFDGDVTSADISGDGRFVAFMSRASNLAGGDNDTAADVFVRDRTAGTTHRVSVKSGGAEVAEDVTGPQISDNGNVVVFQTLGSMVPQDSNALTDVYVRNRSLSTTRRASGGLNGSSGNGHSTAPSISSDGQLVGYKSTSSNLVVGDSNTAPDAFVFSTFLGFSKLASLDSNGNQIDAPGVNSALLSPNGKTIVFGSKSPDVTPDQAACSCAYRRDINDQKPTEVAAVDSLGQPVTLTYGVDRGTTSADASRFGFVTSNPLLAIDTNSTLDVYLQHSH